MTGTSRAQGGYSPTVISIHLTSRKRRAIIATRHPLLIFFVSITASALFEPIFANNLLVMRLWGYRGGDDSAVRIGRYFRPSARRVATSQARRGCLSRGWNNRSQDWVFVLTPRSAMNANTRARITSATLAMPGGHRAIVFVCQSASRTRRPALRLCSDPERTSSRRIIPWPHLYRFW